MQLVNSMELGHSSSSHKDKSTKTYPHTHSRCDYDALCYTMAQSVLNWNEWLFFAGPQSVDGGAVFIVNRSVTHRSAGVEE